MIDKPSVIPYSYLIASASEKGHASGGKQGHKSGLVSLPRFTYTILCGRQSDKTGPGYV